MNEELIVSSAEENPEVLRLRFQEWGYLYFKGYADSDCCDQLAADFLAELSPIIEVEERGGIPELAGDPFFETDPTWDKVYPEMQALESFHSFFHQPDIVRLMEIVSNSRVFVYPIKMARIATPRKLGYETPPHQDAHSHRAPDTMAGMWVALHDVAEDMGRLKILPRSHKGGVRKVFEAQGVGGVQCEIYPEETTWHVSSVGKGDVIIFHACTVHKAEPNTAERAVRLSVDTRFCDYGAPVYFLNLEPHNSRRIDRLDCDYIYRDWKNPELQYYWRDYPNLFQ